jgi:hypothetical protein
LHGARAGNAKPPTEQRTYEFIEREIKTMPHRTARAQKTSAAHAPKPRRASRPIARPAQPPVNTPAQPTPIRGVRLKVVSYFTMAFAVACALALIAGYSTP